MVKKDEFYNGSDFPGRKKRNEIWNNIETEISPDKGSLLRFFDQKSFAMGFAMALVLIFASIGAYKTIDSVLLERDSDLNKLNRIYSSAIDRFENELPLQLANYNKSQKVDDFIFSGKEELQNINSAIYQLKTDWAEDDHSPIKQARLLRLYKMKLDLLEKLIVIEENTL